MFPQRESQPSPSGEVGAGEKTQDPSNQSIPLAPLTGDDSSAAATDDLRSETARLDVVLVLFVMVLAGLLSAFPVRNSDFWMHLATGRKILAGEANFGVDPFSYTTANVYWANTSWAYDVIFFALTRAAGGADEALTGYFVVGVKVLLIGLLALIMMMTRRRQESLWAPAICTILALLAMAWRLNLQPVLFSAFFLALTIFILQRPRLDLKARGPSPKSRILWLLPVLFLIWVNVDEWFILGPATVALFLAGQTLQQLFAPVRTGVDAPESGQLRDLALVLILGLVACLVNPYHIHAFALPGQIATNVPTDALGADRYLRAFTISLFDTAAFPKSAGMVSMSTTYILALLGIASFVLTFADGWRWWRLLVWGAFLMLGAYQARLVIFFAVACAPITALNLQDFARARFGDAGRSSSLWKTWSVGGRLVSGLTCLVLMLLAWPGWLYGSIPEGRYPHRVGFKLEPDESIGAAAQLLADWQKTGAIPADAHMFNWIPDLPAYFAWYQPNAEIGKGFLDYRFNLFPKGVFRDYLEIRKELREGSEHGRTTSELTDLFGKHKIQYLALNWADPAGAELLTAIKDWTQWKVLFMQGTTVIVQRIDAADKNAPATAPRLDPNVLAFGPSAVEAPKAGPGRGPRELDPWQLYVEGPAVRPVQALSSMEYLVYFEAIRKYWPWSYIFAGEAASWGALAASSPCSPMIATGGGAMNLYFSSARTLAVTMGMASPDVATQGHESGPPGALLLAIRYARQAIEAEPDQFQGYSHLASAYSYLSRAQEDRWAPFSSNQSVSPRQVLRRIQLTTALEQALKLHPEEPEPHRLLMDIYGPNGQLKYLDMANEHLRFLTERVALMGPEPGESVDGYRARVEGSRKQLERSEADMTKLRNAFELAAQNKPLFEKAQEAMRHGLGQRALEIMLEMDPMKLSEPQMRLLLDLSISQGRAADIGLSEDNRRELGIPFDWYKAQIAASLGNYDDAYKALESAAEQIENMAVAAALDLAVNQTKHGEDPNNVAKQMSVAELLRQEADFLALAGMIAVEQGKTALARTSFEKALAIGTRAKFSFESKPIAIRYLELLKAAAPAK